MAKESEIKTLNPATFNTASKIKRTAVLPLPVIVGSDVFVAM
jgi:hypothetical protein